MPFGFIARSLEQLPQMFEVLEVDEPLHRLPPHLSACESLLYFCGYVESYVGCPAEVAERRSRWAEVAGSFPAV